MGSLKAKLYAKFGN